MTVKVYASLAEHIVDPNAQLARDLVDDPLERGAKRQILRSVRDDPLAGMYSRSQIDDAQFRAGRMWQGCYESASIGSIQAIDPTKEAVDGGRMRDMLTDRQSRAMAELRGADRALGLEGAALIRDVLGVERLAISAAAAKRGCTSQAEVKYIGRRFRESLETLAVHWGFAARKRHHGP